MKTNIGISDQPKAVALKLNKALADERTSSIPNLIFETGLMEKREKMAWLVRPYLR